MTELTPEMIEKAKTAATPDELLVMAKEAGMDDFTADDADACFAQLHPAEGELSDDELDNIAGGGCYNKKRLVVTVGTKWCEEYECKHCRTGKGKLYRSNKVDFIGMTHTCSGRSVGTSNSCGTCRYCSYDSGLWVCTNYKKMKN